MRTLELIGIALVALVQSWGVGAQQPIWGVPRTPTQGQSVETVLCTPQPGEICSTSSQPPNKTSKPHFSPTWPATLRPNPSQATNVISLLSSLQSSWSAQPSYTSLASAIYIAAPTNAQFSLAVKGWNWDEIVKSEWYNGGTYNDSGVVNTYGGAAQMWKDIVVKQEQVLQRGFDGIFGLKSDAENAGVRIANGSGLMETMALWVLLLVCLAVVLEAL